MVQAPKHNNFFFLLFVLVFLILAASSMKAFAADVDGFDMEQEQTDTYETVSGNDAQEEQVIADETIGSAETEQEQPFDDTATEQEIPFVDYSEQVETIVFLLEYITGILIFFVVVVLCKYIYSFFNIFF